jgi:hypothetical protein
VLGIDEQHKKEELDNTSEGTGTTTAGREISTSH